METSPNDSVHKFHSMFDAVQSKRNQGSLIDEEDMEETQLRTHDSHEIGKQSPMSNSLDQKYSTIITQDHSIDELRTTKSQLKNAMLKEKRQSKKNKLNATSNFEKFKFADND